MIYILLVLLVITITVALYYKDKAKEFESLFELSKGYEGIGGDVYSSTDGQAWSKVKYNKDGSIAKKRGRPVGSKKK